MIATIRTSWPLLLGMLLLMLGNGLQGTLLGVRGDIEGLLKLVADMTGYKYVPVTQQSKGPVLVDIRASTNVTAYEIIRSAGIQAGNNALVEVIPRGFVQSRKNIGLIKLTRK